MDKPDLTPNRTPPQKFSAPSTIRICPECNRRFDLLDEEDSDEWFYGHDCEVEDE